MINTPINEPHGRLDRLQLVALAGLMLIGTAFVYSATMANAAEALKPWYGQTWVPPDHLVCARPGRGRGAVPGGLSHAVALVVRGVLGDDFLPGRRDDSARRLDALRRAAVD